MMNTNATTLPPTHAVAPVQARPAPPQGAPTVLTPKIAAALLGLLISAMMSGLNSRIGALALSDIGGKFGFGADENSWVSVCYSAGEVLIMPFAAWFAVTLSMRRFYLIMLWTTAFLALVTPFIVNFHLLLVLRTLQGASAGALIPLLMMGALRFLPAPIRLHGLALYALTATFAPNIAPWISGYWLDTAATIDWIWWQFIPATLVCTLLAGWGLPKESIIYPRFKALNVLGLALGSSALLLISIGIGQGNRLDWFNSPLITFCLIAGSAIFVGYVLTEWNHPSPFIRFQLLQRRNLQVAFSCFVTILIVLYSAVSLPMSFLASGPGYRDVQSAPLGLIVGLPQLVLGSIVALFLYRKWVDARIVFSCGMVLVAFSCFVARKIDASWTWHEFVGAEVLQMLGQPMAVVSMLFLATSVVQPMEGPYVAGLINMLRALGTLAGVALIGRLTLIRQHFHQTALADRWGEVSQTMPDPPDTTTINQIISGQVTALTTADIYTVLGCLALLVALAGFFFNHIPAPTVPQPIKPDSQK